MGILDGKVAIITGGGRGIGGEITRLFAEQGAALVVNDLGSTEDGKGADAGPASDIVAEITGAGAKAVADGGDIADVATGERLVATAIKEFGRLDIVVNNAGILRDRMIFNLSPEDWDAVIRVHLRGHYSTVRPAAAYFREQRNPDADYRIINFTSASGLYGSPGQPNYAAAKLGIVGLTYSLANGLGRYGVTANAIAPAAATRLVATIPSDRAVGSSIATEESEMAPQHIARVALFLASDRSRWLTGQVLAAQGRHVGLLSRPAEVGSVTADADWNFDAFAAATEGEFRPIIDAEAPNLFARQIR
jgi:NAD(P)-dependent dehydrogenase (short-subunit alcohol dehydrogenase family)